MKRPVRKESITRSAVVDATHDTVYSSHHHRFREIEVAFRTDDHNDHSWALKPTAPQTASYSGTRSSSGSRSNYFDDEDADVLDEHILAFGYGASGLTKDRVRAFLVDYYEDFNSIASQKIRECWKAFYSRHYTPQYRKVRSSGNAIDAEGLIDMYMSNDLQLREMILVSVDSIQIIAAGLVAVAIYTADQRFEYKGIYNHDRTVYSVVIEEIDGEPKIVQEQRTTGVPIPKESRWENSNQETESVSTTAHTSMTSNHSSAENLLSSSIRSSGTFTSSSITSKKRCDSSTAPRLPIHILESQSDCNDDDYFVGCEHNRDCDKKNEDDEHYANEIDTCVVVDDDDGNDRQDGTSAADFAGGHHDDDEEDDDHDDDDDDYEDDDNYDSEDIDLTLFDEEINSVVSSHFQRPAFEDSCRPVVEAAKLPPARRKSGNSRGATTSTTPNAYARRIT